MSETLFWTVFTIATLGSAFVWLLAGLVVASKVWQKEWDHGYVTRWLQAGLVIVAVAIGGTSYNVFHPYFTGRYGKDEAAGPVIPNYDYSEWKSLPVQEDGRTKPFESAAIESLRHITGRSKFEKQSAVAVVVSWMMQNGGAGGTDNTDWEKYPFILCDYQPLRRLIYINFMNEGPELEEKVKGKYVAPQDLRLSANFAKLLDQAEDLREKDKEKAMQYMSPEQRKAEEVAARLNAFDSISQNHPPTLGRRSTGQMDPFHFVALDQVRGGAWFSLSELNAIKNEGLQRELALQTTLTPFAPGAFDLIGQAGFRVLFQSEAARTKWIDIMEKRLAKTPQLYISPAHQKALQEFQERVKDGTAQETVAAELEQPLRERSAKEAKRFVILYDYYKQANRMDRLLELMQETLKDNDENRRRVMDLIRKRPSLADFQKELQDLLYKHYQKEVVEDLKQRAQRAKLEGYHPDDERFRMLHLGYLENRFPNVYKESAAWQKFPDDSADKVLAAFDGVKAAYKTGDAEQFAQKSQSFLAALQSVSSQFGEYPGTDTISLEMQFNRMQPFMWAWIIMLAAFVMFLLSLVLDSKPFYYLGFASFLASLGLQVFGFYARIAISGRPPVSNMYETVVFVPFMTAVFALILELIYRKKIIALAGSMVSTLGLVLADQLPLVLDPKISPLVPVLRSNYWLIVHVLTIVASYAGGALAWGLGNISMTMIAFGKTDRDSIKTLSKFTYRGIQIAVLLLAAGTFLGGWWAAESWGRFWGWDPKEVWALIALVCYVIPLHARFVGWVKDFGLAVSAVVCFAAIMMSWYGVNFVLGAGLHSYGFGGGGPIWVLWAGLLNIAWVLFAGMHHVRSMAPQATIERGETLI